jgi:hypothetical protein
MNNPQMSDAPDDLGALLTLADPLARGLPARLVFDDLPAALTQAAQRKRQRRRRVIAAGLGVIGTFGIALPAAAGYFSAHTGQQTPNCGPLPAGVHCENGTGELIRLDAPDIGSVYKPYLASFPLPPGQSYAAFLRRVSAPAKEPSETSLSGIPTVVGFSARCQWEHAWLVARADGNYGATEQAAAVLEDVSRWRVMTANEAGDGPSTASQIAAAVHADKPGLLQQDVTVNCVPGDWNGK